MSEGDEQALEDSDEEGQNEELKRVKVLKIIKDKNRVSGN